MFEIMPPFGETTSAVLSLEDPATVSVNRANLLVMVLEQAAVTGLSDKQWQSVRQAGYDVLAAATATKAACDQVIRLVISDTAEPQR